ncbi:MAG: nucleotidyltransferase family protein [Sphingomonadaceae bacterium]|nr:nucleotidyltransferase family protein [Sphingomonadaceae bacterium]
MTNQPTMLVLAGKRDGKLDPMAAEAGVSHKCRVPICGKALLQWVLEAAIPAFPDTKVLISIHDPAVIADLPAVVELEHSGRLMICQAQAGIVESVEYAMAQAGGGTWPLVITTADNVLVTPELMRDLHADAMAGDGDAVVVLATREAIQAAHPEGQRRFYEFADAAISNCNLFWLRDATALKAAEAFRQGGQFIKTKGRIAKAFGLINLIRFRLGWWKLDTAFRAISRRLGARVVPYMTSDGAYAVDVDNPRTYAIAEILLKQRKL